MKEIIDFVLSDKLEISIRRPDNGRWWIPKVGFQNQFVTGSSKGYFSPKDRNKNESLLVGKPEEEYSPLDAETKPKYGCLRPSPSSGRVPANSGRVYGKDIYIFDSEKLSERITWTNRDSLWAQDIGDKNSWDKHFVPWTHRELMAPFMLDNWRNGKVGDSSRNSLIRFSNDVYSYIEVQIFGPLTLDHVKAFEFTDTPPQGEFLEELQKRGIEIRDGRTWPPTVWNP